ncbi:arylsulfatase [Arthrobacter crystallopoietes]|uniref:arylsulfatase n=1 Tax=Crystallibacter crystallopoietes TaxID=37928 RepID=UPI001ABEB4EC|nr:arylsulfatase [Arthrobacter crystallopoietes]QTG81757.1 arylsulfatase [Arthrobacter crystallopoietes]
MNEHTDGYPYPVRDYEGFCGRVAERASESVPAWGQAPQTEADAPNVVVMLMDDMGYSDISPFGSEIDTPALEELAAGGYRLGNYQTPPMCSPARASLMTGLNPHRAGFAWVPHVDPGFPNAAMEIPADVPTVAEHFRAHGYATFMVGKWHLTPEAKMHDAAEKSAWPVQRGFDRYYGCMDGFTSLFHPHRLVRDNGQVVIDEYPRDYFLTDDLTDQAMSMVSELRASDPSKPFFLYFAHTAVHGPLQAKAEDVEKYRGRYESGWDHIRAERFRRQIHLGLFPEDTECAPRNTEPGFDVPAWDDLADEQKKLFARYMEVYAASLDNVDQNLRRLLDYLKVLGEYENTIIVFTSDNGGTSEGGDTGTRSYFSRFGAPKAGLPEGWTDDVPRDPALIGGPQTYAQHPRGWAYAANTPFRLYKTFPHAGGVRVPMIVSWPAGLPRPVEDDGLRRQFAHAVDVAPTLMELAGVRPVSERHGLPTRQMDGRSFVRMLRDGAAPAARASQFTELNGRLGFLEGRWKAVFPEPNGAGWDAGEWELYDVEADPAETRNLAAAHPEKVRDLGEKWRAAAWWNQVFPLNDDGSFNRNRPATELGLEQPVTLYPGTPTLERYRSAKLVRLRSFTVDVRLEYHGGDAGVLVAHGDQGGGYVLFIEGGRLNLAYNEYGTMRRASSPISAGRHTVRLRFDVLPEFRWAMALEVDGIVTAELREVFQLVGMAPFAGISVGLDRGGPVDWEVYERHGCFRYTGRLESVRYTPGPKAAYSQEKIMEMDQRILAAFE